MKARLFRAVGPQYFDKQMKREVEHAGVAEYTFRAAKEDLERLQAVIGGDWHIEKLVKCQRGVGECWVDSGYRP